MTIPSTFAAHWIRAIDRGDASGFTNQADFIAFFRVTSMIGGCFDELSDVQKRHVMNLRDSYPAVNEAARRQAIKERESVPRYIGAYAGNKPAPTIEQLAPELAAIEAEIASMPAAKPNYGWDDIVAKVNRQNGFGA